MSSQFGVLFRVTTFGESHGGAVGCTVDGCPPGVELLPEHVQEFLNRRKPGQSEFTSPRAENDTAEILSGTEAGVTLGTPITIIVRNRDSRTGDYTDVAKVFRPSHADYTTQAKYGTRAQGGGGRSSARETIGRVAGAAIAKRFLGQLFPDLEVLAWVERVANIAAQVDSTTVRFEAIEASLIRCPDTLAEALMKTAILEAKAAGDTLGGLVRGMVRGAPVGLGEPVFDKLEADLAKGMLSLPATKSFEVGSGLAGTFWKGSVHNDPFVSNSRGQITTRTNHSGGIQGGISNGMPIEFAVGFKPVSTLFQLQDTVDSQGTQVAFQPKSGRHDACVLPRAVPMVEAMTWLVLADHALRQIALSRGLWPHEMPLGPTRIEKT